MYSLSDIANVTVSTPHYEGLPCSGHSCVITLTNGMKNKRRLDTLEITSLVTNIAKEKITNADWVVTHFGKYAKRFTQMKPEEVLQNSFRILTLEDVNMIEFNLVCVGIGCTVTLNDRREASELTLEQGASIYKALGKNSEKVVLNQKVKEFDAMKMYDECTNIKPPHIVLDELFCK